MATRPAIGQLAVKNSASEHETRIAVAACARLMVHYRLTDLTNGLVAARLPDEPDFCVVNRFGQFYEEITASNLLKMSIHHTDDVELGKDVSSAAAPLFQSLFQAHSDINFIIHTHTKASEVLSTLNQKLLPISHPGLAMHSRTGYVDYAYHHDEKFCATLVSAMQDNVCLLMGNHGMMAVGQTAAEVFFNTFTFDQACLIQLEAYQSGQEIHFPANADEISGM